MNIDLSFLNTYLVPTIVGICLIVGYVLKHFIKTEEIDRYIPVVVAILGVGLNVWMNNAFTPEVLLGGLISGLASTGAHQAFKQIIEHK